MALTSKAGGMLSGQPPMQAAEYLMNFRYDDPKKGGYISSRTFGNKGTSQKDSIQMSDEFGKWAVGLSKQGVNINGLKFHGGFNDKYEGGNFVKNVRNTNSAPTYKESTAHYNDAASMNAAFQQVMIDSLREHGRLDSKTEKLVKSYGMAAPAPVAPTPAKPAPVPVTPKADAPDRVYVDPVQPTAAATPAPAAAAAADTTAGKKKARSYVQDGQNGVATTPLGLTGEDGKTARKKLLGL